MIVRAAGPVAAALVAAFFLDPFEEELRVDFLFVAMSPPGACQSLRTAP
jgi:hypothetical protein